jgi:hypothetical protein
MGPSGCNAGYTAKIPMRSKGVADYMICGLEQGEGQPLQPSIGRRHILGKQQRYQVVNGKNSCARIDLFRERVKRGVKDIGARKRLVEKRYLAKKGAVGQIFSAGLDRTGRPLGEALGSAKKQLDLRRSN